LKGVIKTIQAATPLLRRQNSGRIVTMASVTGRQGAARFPVYSAAKWAVIGLTKTTAEALAPHNVTVNALCPTLVRTGLLENDYVLGTMIPGTPITWEQFEGFAQQLHMLPQGFYGPEHVGSLAAFLCSDEAALISGDVFDIAAGANARFPA
ncbi:MAG: SDR family oxidoreductase, partial [Rhodobacteraceae bacterium]|nr:SDR family oxidoreductase [Paracoccaceae bacterium]